MAGVPKGMKVGYDPEADYYTKEQKNPWGDKVLWVANKRFVSSKFKFNFPRVRHLEIIGLVLGCIEANFCK